MLVNNKVNSNSIQQFLKVRNQEKNQNIKFGRLKTININSDSVKSSQKLSKGIPLKLNNMRALGALAISNIIGASKEFLGGFVPRLAVPDLSKVVPLRKDFLTCGMISREKKESLLRMAKTLAGDHPDASQMASTMTVDSADGKFIVLSGLLGQNYVSSLEENVPGPPIDISGWPKIPSGPTPNAEDLLDPEVVKKYLDGNIPDIPKLPDVSDLMEEAGNLGGSAKEHAGDILEHVFDHLKDIFF